MGQTTAAVRATKKFPGSGLSLDEKCTKCGATFGEHDGQRCPPAEPAKFLAPFHVRLEGELMAGAYPTRQHAVDQARANGHVDFEVLDSRARVCDHVGAPLTKFVDLDGQPIDDGFGPDAIAQRPPASVPTSAPARYEVIDLSKLGESPLNPRKHFDEKKLGELADSVAAKGVLEPILVRPHGKVFEVVAGARRYRAALLAKLKEVPCLVKELTDSEALEVAILENVARTDITAMEEGDGYRALLKMGHTVESLVEKTGRSRTVVFQRMKLAELQGEARELIESGKWSASIGELIARLPAKEAQDGAMKRLEERCRYLRDGLAALSFREAKEILDREFVLHLKDATFDVKDAQLVPSAGACVACPKRTHHADNREAFKDVKVDTCIDGKCWATKKTASFNALQAEVEAAGKKLVKEEHLFQPSYMSSTPNTLTSTAAEKFAKPTDKVAGNKTFADLLGDEVPGVVVLDGDTEKTHKLIDRKAAIELLKKKDPAAAKKLKAKPKKASSSDDSWKKRAEADRKKNDARRQAERVARVKILAKVTKLDDAIDMLVDAWAADKWQWEEQLRNASLPAKTKADKLKPAERVRLIAGAGLEFYEAVDRHAKKAKVDLKALAGKALKATKGTCFNCEKEAPKDDTVCVECGGEE